MTRPTDLADVVSFGEEYAAEQSDGERAEDAEDLLRTLDWIDSVATIPVSTTTGDTMTAAMRTGTAAVRKWLDGGTDPQQCTAALRELLQLAAARQTLGRWQSPLEPAGLMVYERQQVWRSDWLSEAEHGMFGGHGLLFSSMMGATVACLHAAPAGPVLMDSETYFETKTLLSRWPGRDIYEVDARDLEALRRALVAHSPSLVLIDAAPNSSHLPILDIDATLRVLANHSPNARRWVLLDHSLLGPLWDVDVTKRANDDVLLFGRSLQKLDQAGLDLSSGGLVSAHGLEDAETARLVESRAVTGTEMPAISHWFLELPERRRHRFRRLRRFRNGWWLCSQLRQRADRWPGLQLTHCSDPAHPIWNLEEPLWRWSQPVAFVKVPEAQQQRLRDLEWVAAHAETSPVPQGASFGFRDTRVGWLVEGDQMVGRISLGLERADQLEDLVARFEAVFDALYR